MAAQGVGRTFRGGGERSRLGVVFRGLYLEGSPSQWHHKLSTHFLASRAGALG